MASSNSNTALPVPGGNAQPVNAQNQTNQKVIQPIEEFIYAGIQKRFSEVFGCLALWNTAFDKGQVLKKAFEGRTPVYPYAILTPTNMATNPDAYSRKALARHGLYILNDNGITHKVKLVPVIFDVEVEYVTDKFMGIKDTALAFLRRWMMTSVLGHMRFGINYGRYNINIGGMVLSDSVPITPRENPVESTTNYVIQTSMQVKGYVSEPMLIQTSTVQDLIINGQVLGADGSLEGSQFWSFDELRSTNE